MPNEHWRHLKHHIRYMRRNPTPAESRLWKALRNRALNGWKFRQQHPIGPFIVDFYCAAARLVVEVDGPIHDDLSEWDRERESWLHGSGLRIVRVSNDQVMDDLAGVLEGISTHLK
jgi:very-short-patch-repair endonuclease